MNSESDFGHQNTLRGRLLLPVVCLDCVGGLELDELAPDLELR